MAAFEYRHRYRKRRYTVPENWTDIAPRRRLPVFRELLRGNQSEALRLALNIPAGHWRKFHESDRAALLQMCKWTDLEPVTTPHFDTITHNGLTLHAPGADFQNGTCLEFPIADGYLQSFLDGGDPGMLLYLFATLWREPEPDGTTALRREDKRVPLHSRAEIGQRAQHLHNLPFEYQVAALLYFTGIKEMVSELFGKWLFEQEEDPLPGAPDGEIPVEQTTAPKAESDPLGWWGLYFDLAGGDPVKLKAILRSSFLECCLMEVRRRKRLKQLEMKHRMTSPAWGKQPDP